jgi:hypothetical protein
VADPRSTLIAIAQHLHLLDPERLEELELVGKPTEGNDAPVHDAPMHEKGASVGYDSTMTPALRSKLEEFYRPHNEELRQYIRITQLVEAAGEGTGLNWPF